MKNSQLFNLQKIRELTNPIEDLQVELNQLKDNSLKIKNKLQNIEQEFYDKSFLSQIAMIKESLQKINNKLIKVSKINLNKFLEFQDQLIRKYKDEFKDKIKKLEINKEITKKIGLYLVETKKISKIIKSLSIVPSIEIIQWLELIDSLKYNTIFLGTVKKIENYYQDLIQTRLKKELSKIPEDIDPNLIKDYEKYFRNNPTLTFNEFFQIIEKKLTQKELSAKKAIIEKIKEREELEKLKEKQQEQKKTYENYLKLSDTEFKRLRRKKRREKLTDVAKNSTENNSIEISEEVSKKIKKFKSQFEKGFKQKYMIQNDEDKDPIEVIRERRKKKEKEYKQFEDHFKDK
jgi:hypothetical protein